MERFRKLQIIGLERTHHGQSVSYAYLFLYCWISVDIQISSPSFLEKGLSKDQDGKCILNQSRYSKFYKKFWQHPKPQWGPSVPLQYTVDIFTGRPKKTLRMTLITVRCKKIQIEKLSLGVCIWKNIYVPWHSLQINCRFKSQKLCISPSENTCNNFGITLFMFWRYSAGFK